MLAALLKDFGKTPFRTSFAENIFRGKYAQGPADSWPELSRRSMDGVCGSLGGKELPLLRADEYDRLLGYMIQMKWIPGGRYLYYAGRLARFWNNCFLLMAEEDTREEWGRMAQKAMLALMSGGGIGGMYSRLRGEGRILKRTGGVSSGPIPLIKSINEVGRNVMQGGSRRSAMYASLHYWHDDILDFINAKDWPMHIRELKAKDFNFPAPLDMTNISVNWDTGFLRAAQRGRVNELWPMAIRQAMKTGEPGGSFNFFANEEETLRNACGEITGEDDSDVCNLGSVNMSRIESLEEFEDVCRLGAKFLVCGTIRGELPYQKVYDVREKNRRIGLGIMGVHEWLMKRGYRYEMNPELASWLQQYVECSQIGANDLCDRRGINRPIKYRSIAPTGTIGIIASTTTGIEPLYAVAYKRRYLTAGTRWKYEYVIDATAETMIRQHGLDPASIETAYSLAADPERRVKFQYEVQRYVNHAISSTINLPAWGSDLNNESTVKPMADMLLKYVHGLRGITFYPDGSRGGQPLTEVPYAEAAESRGAIYDEVEEKCSGGVCGI